VESKENLLKKSRSTAFFTKEKFGSVGEKFSLVDDYYSKLRKKLIENSIVENKLEKFVRMTKSSSTPNFFAMKTPFETRKYNRKKIEEIVETDNSVSREAANPKLEKNPSLDPERFFFNPKFKFKHINKFLSHPKEGQIDKITHNHYDLTDLSKKVERLRSV
jgi:hypothetical protein